MDHLIELRSRLIKALVAFGIALVGLFLLCQQIYNVLTWPYVWCGRGRTRSSSIPGTSNISWSSSKLSMFGAAFISFRVAAQLYMFVAPGLIGTSVGRPPSLSDRDAGSCLSSARWWSTARCGR